MCCTQLAGNAGPQNRQKIAIWAPLNLSGYIFATKARIDNRKKLSKQQYLPHVLTIYFGQLAAEIVSLVWGTPANYNRFVSRLGSVTARHSSSGRQRNFAALNRGRHLYSAGRPSRWALAHILMSYAVVWSSRGRATSGYQVHGRGLTAYLKGCGSNPQAKFGIEV